MYTIVYQEKVSHMASKTLEKTPALNIRIKAHQHRLIERAAKEAEQTVSDFVRDAAVREAELALMDRTDFRVDADTWGKFIAALDAPTEDNPWLRDLMSREPVWKS